MNNSKINKYLFVVGSFIIVFYLALNTNKDKVESNPINEDSLIIESDFNQIDKDNFSTNDEELANISNNETYNNINDDSEYLDSIEEKQSLSINSIKVAKEIDLDPNSNSFREPISSYKTITTLDKTIIKEIDYYPDFYIWFSVNTESMDFNKTIEFTETNKNEELKVLNPASLRLIVSCNDNIISEWDYQINAKTPRWREWINIDLTELDTKLIIGQWNIQIVDKNNNNILETRKFTFNKELNIDEVKQTAEFIN